MTDSFDNLRPDLRGKEAIRPVTMETGMAGHADASVLIRMGNTHVLCAVTVEDKVPRWMQQQKVSGGWVTAEYRMLPYATHDARKARESSMGKLGGRTQEIQRLIGRSMRAVIDLQQLGSRTVWIDCDVVQADGGTRTAAVTGGFTALHLAMDKLVASGKLKATPLTHEMAAVSVGLINGEPRLDLCYLEDAEADVDMNFVMTGDGQIIEVQGTAEEAPFTRAQLDAMTDLAEKGIKELVAKQRELYSNEA